MMVISLENALDPDSKTGPHEFAHQSQSLRRVKRVLEGALNNSGEKEGGWLDHNQEGIFLTEEPKVNSKNIKTMRSGSNGVHKTNTKVKDVFDTKKQYQENKGNKDE
jgi:uncharacterized protein YneF (UPF0154 family)